MGDYYITVSSKNIRLNKKSDSKMLLTSCTERRLEQNVFHYQMFSSDLVSSKTDFLLNLSCSSCFKVLLRQRLLLALLFNSLHLVTRPLIYRSPPLAVCSPPKQQCKGSTDHLVLACSTWLVLLQLKSSLHLHCIIFFMQCPGAHDAALKLWPDITSLNWKKRTATNNSILRVPVSDGVVFP